MAEEQSTPTDIDIDEGKSKVAANPREGFSMRGILSLVVKAMDEAERQGGTGEEKKARVCAIVFTLVEAMSVSDEAKEDMKRIIPSAIEMGIEVKRFGKKFMSKDSKGLFSCFH